MSILGSLRDIIIRLFGADPVITQGEADLLEMQSAAYRELQGYNLTAIFANKLAVLTVAESTAEVTGDNARGQLIGEVIDKLWQRKRKFTAMAFGTGGALLIPYVTGKRVYIDIVPQSSMLINRVNGDDLRAVSIVADTTIQDDRRYFRWTDYVLDDSGLLTIRNRATSDTGTAVPLSGITEWEDVTEEMTITGVQELPFAYIKCPVDNRQGKSLYGVPVTYGCDEKISEIIDCMEDVRREYKLKKPIVGMDTTLFKVENGHRHLPVTGLFMPTNPGGLNTGGPRWDVYDPAIRDSSYYNRLIHLFEELEKQVGTSRGILTEPATHGATATEIKAANYDTYVIIEDMRQTIARGIEQLARAIDVLANAYDLTPMGEFDIDFDWSYTLVESSQETFNQLLSAQNVGAAEPAEIRMFLYPDEDIDTAREKVAEIGRLRTDLSDQILREAMIRDSRKNLTLEEDDEE